MRVRSWHVVAAELLHVSPFKHTSELLHAVLDFLGSLTKAKANTQTHQAYSSLFKPYIFKMFAVGVQALLCRDRGDHLPAPRSHQSREVWTDVPHCARLRQAAGLAIKHGLLMDPRNWQCVAFQPSNLGVNHEIIIILSHFKLIFLCTMIGVPFSDSNIYSHMTGPPCSQAALMIMAPSKWLLNLGRWAQIFWTSCIEVPSAIGNKTIWLNFEAGIQVNFKKSSPGTWLRVSKRQFHESSTPLDILDHLGILPEKDRYLSHSAHRLIFQGTAMP